MSLLFSLEAIVELIPINFYLQKLSGRLQLRAHSFSNNYILQSLMEPKTNALFKPHSLSLSFLSKCQHKLIKGPVVNMDNCFNKVFSSFDPLNSEFVPRCKIIDTLSSQFSFHSFSKHNKDNLKSQVQQLDYMAIKSLSNPSHALVITDASSISHVHIHNKPIIKTLHYTVNIISTKAELFAIRCNINQATNSASISKIIVVTDLIHIARKIFDLSSHSFQSHTAIILKELQTFFLYHQENLIEFWEYPS